MHVALWMSVLVRARRIETKNNITESIGGIEPIKTGGQMNEDICSLTTNNQDTFLC